MADGGGASFAAGSGSTDALTKRPPTLDRASNTKIVASGTRRWTAAQAVAPARPAPTTMTENMLPVCVCVVVAMNSQQPHTTDAGVKHKRTVNENVGVGKGRPQHDTNVSAACAFRKVLKYVGLLKQKHQHARAVSFCFSVSRGNFIKFRGQTRTI